MKQRYKTYKSAKSDTNQKPATERKSDTGRKFPPEERFPGKKRLSADKKFDADKKFPAEKRYSADNKYSADDKYSSEEKVQAEKKPSFAEIVLSRLPAVVNGQNRTPDIEPLARLDYTQELRIKNEALATFWKQHRLAQKPEAIFPSPKKRHYRTTTKRRVIFRDGKFYLKFSENIHAYSQNDYSYSELEPEEHNAVYKFLLEKINEPAYKLAGMNLNFIIIRGSYTEFSVIFNVHSLNASLVRKFKLLSEHLQKLEIRIISAFLYLDPTRSDYYLENLRPKDQLNFKKLYGPDKLFISADGKKYSFYPTSFSQINESMIPVMLKAATDMLSSGQDSRFIDLYCGYGLFTHYLASFFQESIGIEAEGLSVRSAQENIPYFHHRNKVRFIAEKIDASTITSTMPMVSKSEVFLLDPPRQGTAQGVIKSISQRAPVKVLHIFCGVDQIPPEVTQWTKNGYKVERIVPLDMFPGTPNLEVMILLKKK